MKKIIIFSYGNKDILEKKVNEYLEKNSEYVDDIQFKASKGIISTEYSVMLVLNKR